MMIKIECEDCGAKDPAGFTRYYVAHEVQRVVDGEWKTKESFEFSDGSETNTQCNSCGSANVVEEYTSRMHQVTEYISGVLCGTIEPDDRLQLLENSPEAADIVLSTPDIEAFRISIVQEDFRWESGQGG